VDVTAFYRTDLELFQAALSEREITFEPAVGRLQNAKIDKF
jgi:hypothetical protein